MLLYANMASSVQLGAITINNVSNFQISESVLEMSNTAKITIPRNFKKLDEKPILEQFKPGDKVVISAGYYQDKLQPGDLEVEFTGYITEVESDFPLIVHCEDESYVLRQNNHVLSYKAVTLKQVLTDVVPAGITFECPDVNLGKLEINNESAYTVLHEISKNYGLYSRLNNGHLVVGLAYDFGAKSQVHTYEIGKPNVRKNNLKYKRKEDFKLRFKAIANNPDGTKTTVTLGNTETRASERTLNFAGPMTKAQLKEAAKGVMAKYAYDGYTGDIWGFGTPRTHAGDALNLVDSFEKERAGKYLIEKVAITYNDSDGYARKNTLSYKIE